MPVPYRCLLAATCLLVAALAAPSGYAQAKESRPIDLEGSWYVLVHYQDSSTAHPERTHWLDLIWTFTRKGTRLEWAEYPLVIFDDGSGRFETVAGNPRSRSLGPWEPNPVQRAELRKGPRVNQRGAKVKALKGSASKGWRSSRRMAQTSSVTMMTYHESLTIEDLDTLPLFLREDAVGNLSTDGGRGRTRYQATEVQDGGDTLIGEYERDSIRRGQFRVWRTGAVRGLKKKKGTPNQRRAKQAEKDYLESLEVGIEP